MLELERLSFVLHRHLLQLLEGLDSCEVSRSDRGLCRLLFCCFAGSQELWRLHLLLGEPSRCRAYIAYVSSNSISIRTHLPKASGNVCTETDLDASVKELGYWRAPTAQVDVGSWTMRNARTPLLDEGHFVFFQMNAVRKYGLLREQSKVIVDCVHRGQ